MSAGCGVDPLAASAPAPLNTGDDTFGWGMGETQGKAPEHELFPRERLSSVVAVWPSSSDLGDGSLAPVQSNLQQKNRLSSVWGHNKLLWGAQRGSWQPTDRRCCRQSAGDANSLVLQASLESRRFSLLVARQCVRDVNYSHEVMVLSDGFLFWCAHWGLYILLKMKSHWPY